MTNITTEEALQESQAMNKLLLEIVKTQKRHIRELLRIFIITVVCYTILLLAVIGSLFWVEHRSTLTSYPAITTEVRCTQNTSRADSKSTIRKRRLCVKAATSTV